MTTLHWQASPLDLMDPRQGYGVCLTIEQDGRRLRCAFRAGQISDGPAAINALEAWRDEVTENGKVLFSHWDRERRTNALRASEHKSPPKAL